MSKLNKLISNPHRYISGAAFELGQNLRVARLRRGLSIEQSAERIGTGKRAVSDAEQGKLSTSIAVYIALLREYGLLDPFLELASPSSDEEGLRLLNMRTSSRPKKVDENAPRYKPPSGDNYFLPYWERYDKLDEGY